MLKRLSLFLVVITVIQGCTNTAKVEYEYPQNKAQIDSNNVGSLAPEGALYLVKPSGNK
jgi:hypothetical protein